MARALLAWLVLSEMGTAKEPPPEASRLLIHLHHLAGWKLWAFGSANLDVLRAMQGTSYAIKTQAYINFNAGMPPLLITFSGMLDLFHRLPKHTGTGRKEEGLK